MLSRPSLRLWPAVLAGLAACGGRAPLSVDAGDGAQSDVPQGDRAGDVAGDRPGLEAAVDRTAEVPSACMVPPPAMPGPYAVTLRLRNAGRERLWLRWGCGDVFDLGACPDYAPLPYQPTCDVCACDTCPRCAVCGDCLRQSTPVEPEGGLVEREWAGSLFPLGTSAGCPTTSCWRQVTAPAGKYRITVPIFASEDAAKAGAGPTLEVVDFDLPVPGGALEVLLGP